MVEGRKTGEQVVDELAAARQELAESRDREACSSLEGEFLASIFAAIREPLVVLGQDLTVVLASQAFYDVFQTTKAETQGRYLFALAEGQWDIPNLRERLQKVLPEHQEFDDLLIDQDFGSAGRKTLMLNAHQIPGEGTGARQILLGIQDVTQQKQDEKKLRETVDVLQRESRLAAIGLMITGMTHELNNPLGVILGYSELALREPIVQPARHYVEVIHEATQRASKIVHSVLAFGREGTLEKQGADVRAVIERAVGLKSHELTLDNIKVTIKTAPDLPHVVVDPFQMVQAFLNIITNAEQAMKEAHGGGMLLIHAYRSEDRVIILFEDDGPGISSEHVGRVFDPFFTTKVLGKGTGLGLSVTHGIVSQHGGEIWADSTPGMGARFYVELPTTPPVESETAEPVPDEPEEEAEGRRRVLVVNDEAAFRELLAVALAEDGHVVERARDGEEAWDMVRSRHYDCVILNLWMPRMGGQELHHRIKEYSEDLANKCIFVTGAARSQAVRDFLVSTGNLSVSKPFSLEQIQRAVLQVTEGDES